jgi:hypothetical protein
MRNPANGSPPRPPLFKGGRTTVGFAALIAGLLVFVAGCNGGAEQKDAAAPSKSELLEKTAEKGPVKLTVRLSPKEPRLSDLIQLDVIVTAPLDVEVKPPPFGKSLGEFAINDYIEKASKTENDTRTRTFHYVLEPQQTGRHLIRSIAVEFTDKRKTTDSKAAAGSVETEPLDVVVTSPEDGNAADLANLAPMAPPVELPRHLPPVWVLALTSLGLCALIVFLAYWRTRAVKLTEKIIQRTPEEIAKLELAALLAENLPEKGLYKEFYVRLTGIVRRYIERTTGIRAPEQTTEEFLRDMHFRKIFPAVRAEQLASFLEAADMVKYAGLQPGQRQIEEAIARAQEFVGLSSAFAPLPEERYVVRGT